MKLEEILEFYAGLNSKNLDFVLDGFETILRRLNGKRIGFFIDKSDNFGHQSSTIHLMYHLVELMKKRGLSIGSIIIFARYTANKNEDLAKTAEKLQLMLPGVKKSEVFAEGYEYLLYPARTQKILFSYKKDREPIPDSVTVDFALSGGMDISTGENLADKFRVNYFLRLQPYLWDQPNQIHVRGGEIVNIDNIVRERVFRFDPMPMLDMEAWGFYQTIYSSPRDKIRFGKIKALFEYMGTPARANIWLWPVYGMKNINGDYKVQSLMSLVFMAMYMQNYMFPPKKIVFVLFDTYERYEIETLLNAFKGPKEMIVEMNKLSNAADFAFMSGTAADEEKRKEEERIKRQQTEIQNVWKLLEGSKAEKRLLYPRASEFADALANSAENSVIILTAGPMPAPVFEQCYALADMPGIFEGQGTASIAIRIGKPYIQIPKNTRGYTEGVAIYPFSNLWSHDTALDVRRIIDLLQFRLFLDGDEITDGQYTTRLQLAAGTIYQMTGAALIHRVRDEILQTLNYVNDDYEITETVFSLLYDIICMAGKPPLTVIQEAALPDTRQAAGKPKGLAGQYGENAPAATLEELLERLKKAAGGGEISFHKDFSDMRFSKYLDAVCGEDFILEADTEKIMSEGSPVSSVKVTEAAAAILGGLRVKITIEFTYEEVNSDEGTPYIAASLKAVLPEDAGTAQLSGIPWISFLHPAILLETKESSLPPKGGIQVSDEKEQFKLILGIPTVGEKYQIQGVAENPVTAFDFYNAMGGGVSILDSLPEPLRALGDFGLTKIEMLYNSETVTLERIGFTLGTKNGWIILEEPLLRVVPQLTVTVWNPSGNEKKSVSVELKGQITIGSGILEVKGQYPDFKVEAYLKKGTSIKIAEILEMFGAGIELDSEIDSFSMTYLPDASDFQISAGVGINWLIGGFFEIGSLSFSVRKKYSELKVALDGSMALHLGKEESLDFRISAIYEKGKGWYFGGHQSSDTGTSLLSLLAYFLHCEESEWNLPVTELGFGFNTSDNSWSFTGQTSEPWRISFLDMELKAKIEVGSGQPVRQLNGRQLNEQQAYQLPAAQSGTYVRLSADFIWHGIDLSIWFDYQSAADGSGVFGLALGALTAEVQHKDGQWKAEIKFTKDTSLGSIIEMMIQWCTGEERGLEEPWTLLNKIKFPENTSLIYNFTTGEVKLVLKLAASLDLGFAKIDGVSLSYEYDTAGGQEQKKAMISLEGSFLWNVGDEAVGTTDSLGPWDAATPGAAPVPDGKGNKYFDLKFLALGQNVKIDKMDEAKSIPEAMELFEKMPIPEGETLPAVAYREGDHWLFGADFGVLRLEEGGGYLLDMQMVYNDPALYGLRFTLKGEAAKVLDGFSAEILYRKVNDTVGVYQGELTLPDKMRHLELGAFSLTLPVFYVEIYTNGDFKIDAGFPKNGDFSRSFSLYAVVPPGLPLTGSAGFYFGKLSASTADMVPVTEKGLFQPVFIFGLGIKAGLGKSIDAGVLKAGFELTVMTVVEGVLAKWNPYPQYAPASESYYFRLSGMAGINGRLYGSVDFAIIKADVDVAVSLIVEFVYETCREILLAVSASVSVKASLNLNLGIFKIHIHFSFSIKIREEFSIGSNSKAPWDPDNSLEYGEELKGLRSKDKELQFRWEQLRVLKGRERISLKGVLAGALTGVRPEDGSEGWDPAYVVMILIPSMGEAGQCQSHSVKKALMEEPDSEFEKFSKMLVRYLTAALLDLGAPGQTIGYQEVDSRKMTQAMPEYIKENIDQLDDKAIYMFLEGQIFLEIGTGSAEGMSGVPFPMPDSLQISDGSKSYTFGAFNSIGKDSLDGLKKYFDALAIQVGREKKPVNDLEKMDAAGEGKVSMSHWVFGDYFRLLAKQLAQAMLDVFKDRGCSEMETGEVILSLQQDGVFEHLAGMVSHYQFHGLRIPADGTCFMKAAGLYELTGQQILIPDKVLKEYYALSFSKPDKQAELWYEVEDGLCTIVINPGPAPDSSVLCRTDSLDTDLQRIAEIKKLEKFAIQASPVETENVVEVTPTEYNFANPVPFMDGQIYTLPRALSELLAEEGKAIPKFTWEVMEPDQEKGLRRAAMPKVQSGVLVHIRVKPLDQPCTYEIFCEDAKEPKLLKDLYRQIKKGVSHPKLQVMYEDSEKYWCDQGDSFLAGIIKSNLSTVTHPVKRMGIEAGPQIFGGIEEFVLNLWEAFVTNSGGFYFYYDHDSRKGKGLPQNIFSDDGEAVVSILLLEPDAALAAHTTTVYLEKAAGARQMLTVKSCQETISTTWQEETTIQSLCSHYHSCIAQFARYNKNKEFSQKARIAVKCGLYQYIPGKASPGSNLLAIASWFHTTADEIEKANPLRGKGTTLKDWEAIRLPETEITLKDGCGRTAEEAGTYFGTTAEEILWENAGSQGLYEGEVTLAAGPFTYHPKTFSGAVTFRSDRVNATEALQLTNGEEIESFLENNYTMLGYRIYGNTDFPQSSQAVPAAPSEEENMWKYQLSVPYQKFNSKIGSILQMDYEWVDVFGNTGNLMPPGGNRKPTLIGYMDEMISADMWPSVVFGWEAEKGAVKLHISFDAAAYEGGEGEAQAQKDILVYEQLREQLLDENGIMLALQTSLLEPGMDKIVWTKAQQASLEEWLFTGADSVWNYLSKKLPENRGQIHMAGKGAAMIQVPCEFVVSFELPFEHLNRRDAFCLGCSFIAERSKKIVGAGMQGAGNVLSFEKKTAIYQGGEKKSQADGQKEFIRKFEESFAECDGFCLKLALESQDEWWCVRMAGRRGCGLYLETEKTEPVIYAPRPVKNHLWSVAGLAELATYETGKGILEDVTKKTALEGIDLDIWMEMLFMAVDNMFKPERIIYVKILDEIMGCGKEEKSYYAWLIKVKKALAALGREFLTAVFEEDNKDGSAEGLEEAKEAFYQRLLNKLENFYSTHAVLTWAVKTDAFEETSDADALRLSWESDTDSIISYEPAKTTLRPGGREILPVCADGPELVKTDDGTVITSLTDEIKIKANWMEHGIEKLPDMEGYEDSSWLSFVNPEKTWLSQSLGSVEVPFVLRRFPDSPKMEKQFDAENTKQLENLVKWEYRMEYELPFHFPQDEVVFKLNFNPTAQNMRFSNGDSLALKLAQFQYLYAAVKADLDTFLPQLTADTKPEDARNASVAVESFLILAEAVGNSSAKDMPDTTCFRNGGRSCSYSIKESVCSLTIQEQAWDSVFVAGIYGEKLPTAGMPVFYVRPEEYSPVILREEEGMVTYWYQNKADKTPLRAADAQQVKSRQIGMPGLNIFRFQSAVSELTVDRNKYLAEGRKTAEPFVYTTGAAAFKDVFYAAKDISEEIDITVIVKDHEAGSGQEKDTFTGYLDKFFSILMEGDTGQKITLQMECQYARKLGDTEEWIVLPVFMQPCIRLSDEGEKTLSERTALWEEQILAWCRTHLKYDSKKGPWNEKNRIELDLTVFSDQTEQMVPLIRLRKLMIPGAFIKGGIE